MRVKLVMKVMQIGSNRQVSHKLAEGLLTPGAERGILDVNGKEIGKVDRLWIEEDWLMGESTVDVPPEMEHHFKVVE